LEKLTEEKSSLQLLLKVEQVNYDMLA
jgi:hypothetical protein